MIDDSYVFYALFLFFMIIRSLFWIYSHPDCGLDAYNLFV